MLMYYNVLLMYDSSTLVQNENCSSEKHRHGQLPPHTLLRAYADVCRSMLTYADVCPGILKCPRTLCGASFGKFCLQLEQVLSLLAFLVLTCLVYLLY